MPATMEWHDFAELSAKNLYEILQFRQAIFVVEQGSPYADLDGLDEAAHHLVVRIEQELAGYLRVIPFAAERRVAIGRVCVNPASRGRSLARELMITALARCALGYRGWPITLSGQCYLVPFYERLGFRRLSEPYDDCGVPHVDMALAHSAE